MTGISIDRSELRRGDVIVDIGYGNNVTVERTGPDDIGIYSFSKNLQTVLFKSNGYGNWHAYRHVDTLGMSWSKFQEHFNIPDNFKRIGTREV